MQYTFFKTKHTFSALTNQPKPSSLTPCQGGGQFTAASVVSSSSSHSNLSRIRQHGPNGESGHTCAKNQNGDCSPTKTELNVNCPQPRCPPHMLQSRSEADVSLKGPKLFTKQAGVGPHGGLSVLFEKRMLHLWLVALCACSHVTIHPTIKSQVSRTLKSLCWQWIWTTAPCFF